MPDLLKILLDPFHRLYYAVLIFASVTSYFAYKKGNYQSIFLLVILIITTMFELLTSILRANKVIGYIFIYSIFNAVEYTFLSIYYLNTCKLKKAKVWVRISIILFSLNSLVVAYLVHKSVIHYQTMFTRNFNIEAMLLFIIYVHLLFNIDDDIVLPIYEQPDFWISVGVLVFFGGVFVLFGLYPILLHVDNGNEYGFIINPLNIFLYISITIGQLCLLRNKKYLIQ